ncbi:MAG: DNA polymerase III subunit [Pyrinomonadaceae bacterium MAG19_C2-C3]|nr:DNA polymerase III subunit [Pyrinomonadaceae bacterium MAG19_C2-C3]
MLPLNRQREIFPVNLTFMFANITGNEATKTRLLRMINSNRVPGALLFAGASGVSKRLFAIELAKTFNCLNPITTGIETGEACDVCGACRRIATLDDARERIAANEAAIVWSDHKDVGLIVPDGRFIKIEQAREIAREANFRPAEGHRRVFIVDDADRLNEAAANALLKTLEEMNATTYLILVSSRPDALLPTIRSRCQTLRFAPLTAAEIESHLIHTKQRAGEEARLAARLARGNLALALNFNLDAYQAQREQILTVLDALASKRDRARVLRIAEEISDPKHKEDFESTLDTFEITVRDVWHLALHAHDNTNDTTHDAATISAPVIINGDIAARLAALATRLAPRTLALFLTRIDRVRRELHVNINRRLATDALLLGIIAET